MEPSEATPAIRPSRVSLILGFLSVYLIWGSTYLAIRFAVASIPPFTMAGARYALAGALLYVWALSRGAARPTWPQWRDAAISGTLMLLGGNGIVTWAEQWVPSSLAALIISSVPLWMGLLQWMVEPSSRPRRRGTMGLLLGIVGVAILVRPGTGLEGDRRVLLGSLSLVLAAGLWAAGSLHARRARPPSHPILSISLQMLAGGAALLIAAAATGEPARVRFASVTFSSAASFLYLVFFGSIVGFSSYVWLLRVTAPAKVATYAYVNPIVAVFLGATLGKEPVSVRTLFAAAIIVGAVVLITSEGAKAARGSPSRGARDILRGDAARRD